MTKPFLSPTDHIAIDSQANAIRRRGLRCAIEVRTGASHACEAGWEPRVIALDPETPAERVLAALEETRRLEPDHEVRLVAYTPALRRVEQAA